MPKTSPRPLHGENKKRLRESVSFSNLSIPTWKGGNSTDFQVSDLKTGGLELADPETDKRQWKRRDVREISSTD